jgi:hypothetical protein
MKCPKCNHTTFGVTRQVWGTIYQSINIDGDRISVEDTEDSGKRYGELSKFMTCESCKTKIRRPINGYLVG